MHHDRAHRAEGAWQVALTAPVCEHSLQKKAPKQPLKDSRSHSAQVKEVREEGNGPRSWRGAEAFRQRSGRAKAFRPPDRLRRWTRNISGFRTAVPESGSGPEGFLSGRFENSAHWIFTTFPKQFP